MRNTLLTLIAGLVSVAATNAARAGVITFDDDYEGFLAAAGDVQTIDFETLPDGSTPIYAIENPITPEFNYTEQGVTFSPFVGRLFVQGTPSTGHSLFADTYPDLDPRNWIIADLVTPAWAVGVFFSGGSYLYAYDAEDRLITSVVGGGSGRDHFLGIVSEVPIASAAVDRMSSISGADSFHFTPIPEPATVLLCALGGMVLFQRRRRVR